MTASSSRNLSCTTAGAAGRRDIKSSSLAHVCLAQVREKTFPSLPYFHYIFFHFLVYVIFSHVLHSLFFIFFFCVFSIFSLFCLFWNFFHRFPPMFCIVFLFVQYLVTIFHFFTFLQLFKFFSFPHNFLHFCALLTTFSLCYTFYMQHVACCIVHVRCTRCTVTRLHITKRTCATRNTCTVVRSHVVDRSPLVASHHPTHDHRQAPRATRYASRHASRDTSLHTSSHTLRHTSHHLIHSMETCTSKCKVCVSLM